MTPKRQTISLLVVDDSADTRELLQRNLSSKGYEVFTASDVAESMRIIGSTYIDLVITDLKMPGASGLDLVRHIRENFKDIEVMIITGYPSVEGAVAAVKSGAEEYLTKPFTKEELFSAVERTLEKLSLRRAGRTQIDKQLLNPSGMIGESEGMQKVFRSSFKAACSKIPVLISGERGTGKELLAKAIHFSSSRYRSPFMTIRCTGLGEEDIERLLFGDGAGGSYGKASHQKGLFESIGDGTLYLDDIAELSGTMQIRLLEVLEGKEIFQAVSGEIHPADFVLIAGTSRNLRQLTDSGSFQEDLFVRLSMAAITVPPLRDRDNDIILLARHFLSKYAGEINRTVPRFSEQALQVIRNYSWPGNIAELENVINWIIRTAEAAVIDIPDLPSHMRFSVAGAIGQNRSLADVEVEHIKNVIASVDGNKTRAAEILGINRKTLREKLRQTGSPDPPD